MYKYFSSLPQMNGPSSRAAHRESGRISDHYSAVRCRHDGPHHSPELTHDDNYNTYYSILNLLFRHAKIICNSLNGDSWWYSRLVAWKIHRVIKTKKIWMTVALSLTLQIIKTSTTTSIITCQSYTNIPGDAFTLLVHCSQNFPLHTHTVLLCLFCCGFIMNPRRSYRQISNISRTKSQNFNVSRLILQLPLPNPFKPGVKSRMKT